MFIDINIQIGWSKDGSFVGRRFLRRVPRTHLSGMGVPHWRLVIPTALRIDR